MSNNEFKTLELIFPQGIFDWFEIVASSMDEKDIKITFQEKNIPPLSEVDRGKKCEPKGFTEITITDFPIRGRRALLEFRRRYWQIEGEKEYLKRDIQLAFPGTQLATEFANFLKETCGGNSDLALLYRDVSMSPNQGV